MTDVAFPAPKTPPLTAAEQGMLRGRQPLATVRADQVTMRSIEWLDKPFLQRAAFHLVAGPKGVGKGTWLAKIAASMTRGAYGRPQEVLFVVSEDSIEIDIVPRLKAAKAELSRVHLVTESFRLPADIARLKTHALELDDVGLIVIDPLSNHIGSVDTDKEGAVRHAIADLNQLADEADCVVAGVRHLGKARRDGALRAVLGSTAWVDLPRAVIAFARDDEDDMTFHAQVIAGNRSGRSDAEAFRMELADVGLKEPVTRAVALGESRKSVDDLLSANAGGESASRSARARALLLDILESEGPTESDTLDARVAAEAGLAARTVRNIRMTLRNEGLIRANPSKGAAGEITRWLMLRTEAPRP